MYFRDPSCVSIPKHKEEYMAKLDSNMFLCWPAASPSYLWRSTSPGKEKYHPFKKRTTAMCCGPREREPYPLWQILSNCRLVMVVPVGWDTRVFDVYRVKADRYQCLDHGTLIFTHNAKAQFLSKTRFPDHQGFIKDYSQRHHFALLGLCSQAVSFPVVTYGC